MGETKQPFSSRPVATSNSGIQVIVQVPNGAGWITSRMNFNDFIAGVAGAPIRGYNQSGNFNFPIPANTLVTSAYVFIVSGIPTVQIGITDMGTEILEPTLLSDDTPISISQKYSSSGNIYFYVTEGEVDVRLDITPNLR